MRIAFLVGNPHFHIAIVIDDAMNLLLSRESDQLRELMNWTMRPAQCRMVVLAHL